MSTNTNTNTNTVETTVIQAWNPPTQWVKDQILKAGTNIGSVHFKKRSSGELRKMCYRLKVKSPSIAKAPKGISYDSTSPVKRVGINRKDLDAANSQVTVLDCNKTVRDANGAIIGRGAWRCIPLENVIRIKNKGIEVIINRY